MSTFKVFSVALKVDHGQEAYSVKPIRAAVRSKITMLDRMTECIAEHDS
jgi:hypothetical protein